MRIYLISDLHLGHEAMYKFTNFDGSKVRPWDTAAEGDEHIILQWNKTVRPEDKVYVLGDVVMKKKDPQVLYRLMGTKVLIRGNHDQCKLSQYARHFKDVRGSHVIDNYIMTHIPIHPHSLGRWKGNIHGHLHNNIVTTHSGHPDLRYYNVSVERINYTPIDFELVKMRIKNDK